MESHCEWVELNLNSRRPSPRPFNSTLLYSSLYIGKSKSKSKGDESSDNSNNDKNNNKAHNGEVLDLRDLDLSQLRLTKKDLETLSSLTPSLSKSLQDQLLAQLPPNQAKKLSRTLSVQNGKISSEASQLYRRSISNNPRELVNRYSRDSVTPTNEVFDNLNNNNKQEISSRYRRSVSRDETFDDSMNNNSRASEMSIQSREATLSPTDFRGQYYSSLKSNSKSTSLRSDIQRICFSPEPLEEKPKPKHKRLSRFMSPQSSGYELYDEPRKIEKPRELESHKILRELCEKSREKSVEKEPMENRISYFLDKYATNEISKHLLNGNFVASESNQHKIQSRSDTASSSHSHSSVSSTINDKILDELNSISLLNGQLEKFDQRELQTQDKILKKKVKSDGTIKKLVKKVKDKSPDDSRADDLSVGKTPSSKRESKLARPKSYVSKDSSIQPVKSSERLAETVDGPSDFDTLRTPSKLTRPKSFPNSKITPPKDIKFPDSLANILNLPNEPAPVKTPSSSEILNDNKISAIKQPESEPKKMKKVIKVVKKSSKNVIAVSENELISEVATAAPVEVKREKSPEKKTGRGLLFTIGQKFEKLRETTKTKDKEKDKKETEAAATDMKEKKKKIKAMLAEDVDEATRQERKSKIDAMIKNLKEKSLPHNTELTESGLIKRAVSVEEMPNTFNKNTVNKVLGLFKRIEKENSTNDAKVQNTKSTGYLSYNDYDTTTPSKERPKSSGFVHKIKKNGSAFEPLNNISESKIPVKYATTCPECTEIVPSKSSNTVNKREQKASAEEKERIKNNRKGLMLDFSKFEGETKATELKESSSRHNNYSFPPPLPQEINQNLQTPTYDSLTNYSSSPYDESSTLLSPTDDVGFDRWSTCSEDDHHHALPPHPMGSSSLSRLSRSSRNQTPIDESESNESVVDRIRRKSFYSRFNEKKPKRVSNIVGPAAKDYYRERSVSRPLEYTKSATSIIPDLSGRSSNIDTSHIRATSITRHMPSSATARSLSQTRSTSKYSSEKASDSLQHSNSYRRLNYDSSHMASLPPPHHHHHHHHDLLMKSSPDDISARIRNNRSTMYDSSSSSSNTPSLTSLYAKRRSYVSTPSSSSGTTTFSSSAALKPPPSFVDGYATIGRKMRQYNSRTVSLLDPTTINSTNNYVSDHHHRVNGYMDLNESLSRFVPSNHRLPTIRHNAIY